MNSPNVPGRNWRGRPSGLAVNLADTLIDRVYVYPDNPLEIVWKMKEFCMKGM